MDRDVVRIKKQKDSERKGYVYCGDGYGSNDVDAVHTKKVCYNEKDSVLRRQTEYIALWEQRRKSTVESWCIAKEGVIDLFEVDSMWTCH